MKLFFLANWVSKKPSFPKSLTIKSKRFFSTLEVDSSLTLGKFLEEKNKKI